MPIRYRSKGRRFVSRRRKAGRTTKRRRVTVRRGRHGAVIGPLAAYKAIRKIAKNAAAEIHYTDYGTGADWQGFSQYSEPADKNQNYSVLDVFGLSIPDGLSNEATKEGLRISPKRLDLYFYIEWHARMGPDLLYNVNGKWPPPAVWMELMVCQMKTTTTGGTGGTQALPGDSAYTTAQVYDLDWYGRKRPPEWFIPTLISAKAARANYTCIAKKTFKFRRPYMPPPCYGDKSVVWTGTPSKPTSLVDKAAGVQPGPDVNQAGQIIECGTMNAYKSLRLNCKDLFYANTTGTTAGQVQGRIFLAIRWWHPPSGQLTVATDTGVKADDVAYEPPNCLLRYRATYLP